MYKCMRIDISIYLSIYLAIQLDNYSELFSGGEQLTQSGIPIWTKVAQQKGTSNYSRRFSFSFRFSIVV